MHATLQVGDSIILSEEHAHYLKNVLRRQDGDSVRIFNGMDGEFLCHLRDLGKKSGLAHAAELIRAQPSPRAPVHLYFAPIKKNRLEWMIEKAVELGATDLHPVITQNTEVRDLNIPRTEQQIIEAAEQSESMTLPRLHPVVKLSALTAGPILACLERADAKPLATALPPPGQPVSFLIGPEGGFTADEMKWINTQPHFTPVSLGENILRAETAACYVLSAAGLNTVQQ